MLAAVTRIAVLTVRQTLQSRYVSDHVKSGVASLRQTSNLWPPVKIHVGVNPTVNVTVGAKTGPPSTPNEARFHSPYLMAVLATSQKPIEFILPEHSLNFHEYMRDPAVIELMNNVTHAEEFAPTEFYHTSNVRLTFADGSTDELLTTAPRGSAKNQLSDEGTIAKFDTLAKAVSGEKRALQIRESCVRLSGSAFADICRKGDAILNLETAKDVKALFSLLGGSW